MQRISDPFLDTLETVLPLTGNRVLEIGCGDGRLSRDIARRCAALTAIDPDIEKIKVAEGTPYTNATFQAGSAESLVFSGNRFDVIMFPLSFHHVPPEHMETAIDEALRVMTTDGRIVWLEPEAEGPFFTAEILFNACDGDERVAKAIAYETILSHTGLIPVDELPDVTIFEFDSVEDFITSMHPKQNLDQLQSFLEACDYRLLAPRRINISRRA